MAHKRFLKHAFAFLALALVIALAFSTCSNPSGPDLTTEPLSETYTAVKGGVTYKLTITQSAANAKAKAAFTPAEGDSYVLEITEKGVTKTSSGKVKAYSNNKFTLTASTNASASFEVTVSSSGITNITGTIATQDGATVTAPGSLTTTSGGGGGGGGGGGTGGGGGSGGSGGTNSSITTFTDIEAFRVWLADQPANTINKPYPVALKLSSLTTDLRAVLQNEPNKYVNLDFSGSTFTSIGEGAFRVCTGLTSITIPDSVTIIEYMAFEYCTSLINVTFQGTSSSVDYDSFPGDLRDKYLAGGIGTYTRPSGSSDTWTKR